MTKPPAAPLRPYHVLFLCTGNSARSIMAEAILNLAGRGQRFVAYSAGSHPKGAVHPETVNLLTGLGYDHSALRSKSWDEFAAPEAPPIDFVITLCDEAAGEACPLFFGAPLRSHWPTPDPARPAGGDSPATAHARAYWLLEQRMKRLLESPEALDRAALADRIAAIGRLAFTRRS
ncbi:MAG: arsenate reductase ArsC [Bauldia sp.]